MGDARVEEAEATGLKDEEEFAVGECMAMRMRRALGEADVMGDGGTDRAASEAEVGEARWDAAEELDDTFNDSCFLGVTFTAAGAASEADDEAINTFFLLTGVTATTLLLPTEASAAADEEAVKVVTILLLLLPLGVFSTAARRALSLCGVDADLADGLRSAARSRMSAGVLSAGSRPACCGLRAGTGCLVASMRGYQRWRKRSQESTSTTDGVGAELWREHDPGADTRWRCDEAAQT